MKPEAQLQQSCINYFRYQYPKYIIYAVPNGGSRNIIEAANLKRQGVLSGVPDLCIPVKKGDYGALYIELKSGKNKTTEKQNEVIEKLRSCGNRVEVVYNLDDFIKIVDEYFGVIAV